MGGWGAERGRSVGTPIGWVRPRSAGGVRPGKTKKKKNEKKKGERPPRPATSGGPTGGGLGRTSRREGAPREGLLAGGGAGRIKGQRVLCPAAACTAGRRRAVGRRRVAVPCHGRRRH